MFVYTIVDESYYIKVLTSRDAVLEFTSGMYTRSGEVITKKVLQNALGCNGLGSLNVYIKDEDGEIKNDWTYKIEGHSTK